MTSLMPDAPASVVELSAAIGTQQEQHAEILRAFANSAPIAVGRVAATVALVAELMPSAGLSVQFMESADIYRDGMKRYLEAMNAATEALRTMRGVAHNGEMHMETAMANLKSNDTKATR